MLWVKAESDINLKMLKLFELFIQYKQCVPFTAKFGDSYCVITKQEYLV